MSALEVLRARVHELIDVLADGGRDDAARDALLRDLLAEQARSVAVYGRLRASDRHRALEPALPTDVFRFARVASHESPDDLRRFQTSGTTQGLRGLHALRDLRTYDRAAQAAARYALFPDRVAMRVVMLAPHESEAPDSSLSYMLSRFAEWFADGPATWAWHGGRLDLALLEKALDEAHGPVALLGTSFAFVHAEDGLGDRRFALPEGSRIMQTGGFKGRSREVDPDAMVTLLARRYGVPETHVIAEYGMTELSSQLYESTLREAVLGAAVLGEIVVGEAAQAAGGERRGLWVPGWVRATVVHPETLEPLAAGEVGVLRLDDLANVDSVAAIQTSDLAFARGSAIVLLGRAPGAIARGCSLAVEEALSR